MKKLFAFFLVCLAITGPAQVPLIPIDPPGPFEEAPSKSVFDKGQVTVSAEVALREAMTAFQWSGSDSSWNGPEDSQYWKPTKEQIAEFLKFFRASKAPDKYAAQSNDCDENAREALYFARLWGNRHFKGKGAAIMIGAAYVEILSTKPRKSYHVLNFIGYANGTWGWFEPQGNEILSLKDGLKQYKVVKLQF